MFRTLFIHAPLAFTRTMVFALAVAGTLGAQPQTPPAPASAGSGPGAATACTSDTPLEIINIQTQGTASAGQPVQITITGCRFADPNSPKDKPAPAQDLSFTFLPSGSATIKSLVMKSDGSIAATVKIASNVSQTIHVRPHANTKDGDEYAWDTGIAVNDCLEATKAGGCELRWEVDATGITGLNTQVANSTAPNIMVKLDWQIAKNKDSSILHTDSKGKAVTKLAVKPGAQGWDRFAAHLVFKTGLTQIPVATQLQPASSTTTPSGGTGSGTSTAGSSSTPCTTSTTTPTTTSSTGTTAATCTAATTQQAFVADAGGHIGWTFAQDGSGTFAEFGASAHGSLEGVVAGNSLFQQGTINYQAVTGITSQDVIRLGEVTARFRLASHDGPASAVTGVYANTSDLLRIEGGYQYNSGLGRLAGNPSANTTERLVARFYLFPELPNSNHTRIPIGIEYSSGIHGGPRILQVVYGTNLNLGKLFGSKSNE